MRRFWTSDSDDTYQPGAAGVYMYVKYNRHCEQIEEMSKQLDTTGFKTTTNKPAVGRLCAMVS